MSLLVVIAGLLLAGALGLLYFPWSGKGAVDRDALNRALYQSRLQELAQERGEDNPALVVELQRTLLTDIPPQAQSGERPLRRWALLPGALLLVVLSLGLYLKTSDIGQVLLWQQAERHYPALLQQVKDRRRRRCEWMSWRSCGLACAATCRIRRTTSPAGSCLGGWACC